jgi:hypothetical protein
MMGKPAGRPGLWWFPLTVLLAACPVPDSPGELNPVIRDNAESRLFNVRRADTNAWYQVTAFKYAEGDECLVYVDGDAGDAVSVSAARAVAAEFDTKIYRAITPVFGDYREKGFDVDGNGKLILLLLDIRDDSQGSGNYVAGYFDSHHMTGQDWSNRADMLFIDINPQRVGSQIFYTNIAHELQHLINYAVHGGNPQELWINEGLSCAAEYLYGGLQMDRLHYFNNDPRGTITGGNNFFVWDGDWEKEGDSLANYATVYLFFQWLRIHSRGTLIYSAIGNSAYRDYRAVAGAAKTRIPGLGGGSFEQVWDTLLSSWMAANYLKAPAGSPQELYGYRGELDTYVHYFSNPGQVRVSLAPGEGVFSLLTKGTSSTIVDFSHITDSGAHIRYLGMDRDASAGNAVTRSPPYAKVLLTYNVNPDTKGLPEGGYAKAQTVPTRAAYRTGSPESVTAAPGLTQSYPVSVHDLRIARGAGKDRDAEGTGADGQVPAAPSP